ncbi:hypothetical protein CC2G_013617 [Coprinopsis cinerea AmutBmut pab1-1]|nr:hypothetical protein CC2G_013617 [Coprinopsis cinerea AmutBmut pab1-1]
MEVVCLVWLVSSKIGRVANTHPNFLEFGEPPSERNGVEPERVVIRVLRCMSRVTMGSRRCSAGVRRKRESFVLYLSKGVLKLEDAAEENRFKVLRKIGSFAVEVQAENFDHWS